MEEGRGGPHAFEGAGLVGVEDLGDVEGIEPGEAGLGLWEKWLSV